MTTTLRRVILACPAVLLLTVGKTSAQAPPQQDTTVPGTTARLAVVGVFDNVLLVSIALKNSEAKEAELPVVEYSKFSLVDAAGAAKHFPLRGANGHYLAGPISDWNGGRWYPHVPAKDASCSPCSSH